MAYKKECPTCHLHYLGPIKVPCSTPSDLELVPRFGFMDMELHGSLFADYLLSVLPSGYTKSLINRLKERTSGTWMEEEL